MSYFLDDVAQNQIADMGAPSMCANGGSDWDGHYGCGEEVTTACPDGYCPSCCEQAGRDHGDDPCDECHTALVQMNVDLAVDAAVDAARA